VPFPVQNFAGPNLQFSDFLAVHPRVDTQMMTSGFWVCLALAIVVSIASIANADPDLPSYLANGATPNIETIKSCSLVIPADDNQAISGSFNLRAFVELCNVQSVHPG
jgi:hypothetical protein